MNNLQNPSAPVVETAQSRFKQNFYPSTTEHFQIHKERPFLKEERATTTILVGGLSPTHDFLFEGSLKALGLNVKMLPPTNLEAFHVGREYGNNGYCNPAYFTVGNLIRFLRQLRKQGMSKEEIIEKYIFFTIGCNAPCRFGMLEHEYRMALKDCGFEGFRVIVFQNEGGLNQEVRGDGIKVNPEFFLATVNALNLADVINDLTYATRPYEVIQGQTDEVLEKAKRYLYQKLKNKKRVRIGKNLSRFFALLKLEKTASFIQLFLDQLYSKRYTDALKRVREMFEDIEVDRLKSKTSVKITGEFWAITTVGAGNFNMFSFLEKEGSVLMVEPVASLIQFLFSKGKLRHENKRQMLLNQNMKNGWDWTTRFRNYLKYQKKYLTLKVGNYLFRREYKRLLKALGGDYKMLIHQPILQKIANPHYNINIEGGEGYMEIAKNVYYHEKDLAHMVLSLKPFGCMPSTQSDGAQAVVLEMNKDMIFLPLETAGEGETNAQSRVLMSLGDARVKAKKEMNDAREAVNSDMDTIHRFVEEHPELRNPIYVVPQKKGIVNRAAHFLYHVDDLIRQQATK